MTSKKINKERVKIAKEQPWWLSKMDKLLNLGERSAPAYVYDLEEVTTRALEFKKLSSVNRVYYAVKANSNPRIIKHLYKLGLYFDCVSIDEVKLVLKVLPGQESRILFTPNFASLEEYRFALRKKILITLDNRYLLDNFPKVFAKQKIALRLEVEEGRGHHQYAKTGHESKFGLPLFDLPQVLAICAKHKIEVIGLHGHVGSGILDAKNWAITATYLAKEAQKIPTISFLDIGGGFGIPADNKKALDFLAIEKKLQAFRKKYPNYQLWVEPGRFLVARAGVILAKMTQLKEKGDKTYLGLEIGMNALIRPALYGAFHRIENLTNYAEAKTVVADIVGPICESGDFLGQDRKLPKSSAGDIFLIENCGAYGRAMASNYNSRPFLKELFI